MKFVTSLMTVLLIDTTLAHSNRQSVRIERRGGGRRGRNVAFAESDSQANENNNEFNAGVDEDNEPNDKGDGLGSTPAAANSGGEEFGANEKGVNANGGLNGNEFCAQFNLNLADGTQNKAGACSITSQGSIPTIDNMVSTLILQPANLEKVDRAREFTIVINVKYAHTPTPV